MVVVLDVEGNSLVSCSYVGIVDACVDDRGIPSSSNGPSSSISVLNIGLIVVNKMVNSDSIIVDVLRIVKTKEDIFFGYHDFDNHVVLVIASEMDNVVITTDLVVRVDMQLHGEVDQASKAVMVDVIAVILVFVVIDPTRGYIFRMDDVVMVMVFLDRLMKHASNCIVLAIVSPSSSNIDVFITIVLMYNSSMGMVMENIIVIVVVTNSEDFIELNRILKHYIS